MIYNKQKNNKQKRHHLILCITILFISIICIITTSCKSNKIDVPTNIITNEENILSWDSVDLAKSYNVRFYYIDQDSTYESNTRKTNYSLDQLEVGDYEIRVQSISGVKDKKDSEILELKEMISKLHENGIRVIMDVVYNHMGEGDAHTQMLSLKGIDSAYYYVHNQDDKTQYRNETGCGNALDMTKPMARKLAVDSLRYWAEEMGVDGFRFDLMGLIDFVKVCFGRDFVLVLVIIPVIA